VILIDTIEMLRLIFFVQMIILYHTLKFKSTSSFSSSKFKFFSKRRQLDDSPEIDIQNQYDIKRVQFQTKLGLNLENPVFELAHIKTGQQMRKDRKRISHKQTNKIKNQAEKIEPPKRFMLGNGMEILVSNYC